MHRGKVKILKVETKKQMDELRDHINEKGVKTQELWKNDWWELFKKGPAVKNPVKKFSLQKTSVY